MMRLSTAHRFARSEKGSTLVEFGIAVPLFLLLVFGILDYGRLYWNEVTAQKATAIAVRIAAVRNPACPSSAGIVPGRIDRQTGSTAKYGAHCSSGGICAVPPEISCSLGPLASGVSNTGTLTAIEQYDTAASMVRNEIWNAIWRLLPPRTEPEQVWIVYSPNLTASGAGSEPVGFLGGPYSPIVTAELRGIEFQFVSPLGQLAALAANNAAYAGKSMTLDLPSMSASLPGEDLAHGPKPRISP